MSQHMSPDHLVDEENDDELRGRILTRREVVSLIGGGALAMLLGAGCGGGGSTGPSTSSNSPSATATPNPNATATPTPVATAIGTTTCVARPELTEGPYFVDEKLNRSDIRSDPGTGTVQSGVLLTLKFNVGLLSGGSCAALTGALVDVWHANALGKYSDIASEGTSGQKFLRGYQTTPSSGLVTFTTIYPGWYSGRAVHIHFKIRATIAGSTREFTSQLFFNDSLTTQVYAASPYNTRGTRSTYNSGDDIYSQSGGQTLINLTGSNNAGYTGTFNVALSV